MRSDPVDRYSEQSAYAAVALTMIVTELGNSLIEISLTNNQCSYIFGEEMIGKEKKTPKNRKHHYRLHRTGSTEARIYRHLFILPPIWCPL